MNTTDVVPLTALIAEQHPEGHWDQLDNYVVDLNDRTFFVGDVALTYSDCTRLIGFWWHEYVADDPAMPGLRRRIAEGTGGMDETADTVAECRRFLETPTPNLRPFTKKDRPS